MTTSYALRKSAPTLDEGGFIAKSYKYDDLNRLTHEKLSDHKA